MMWEKLILLIEKISLSIAKVENTGISNWKCSSTNHSIPVLRQQY